MTAMVLWARAELRRNRASTIALALLVALGTGVALGALAGARRTSTTFDRLLDSTAAATHRVQYTTSADADEEIAVRAARDPDIEAHARVHFVVAFADDVELDIGVVSSPDPSMFRDIDGLRLVDGRPPHDERPDEVVVNEVLARAAGASVGEQLVLRTFSAAQLDEERFGERPAGPVLRLRVVGVSRTADDLADDQAAFAYASTAFHAATSGVAGGFGPSLALRLRDGADIDVVVRRLLAGVPQDEDPDVETLGERGDRVRDALRVLTVGLLLFAAAAAVAALVAAGQALMRRMADVARDGGALRALGATRRHRVAGTLLAVLPAILAGTGLGVVVAVAGSPLLPFGIARRAEPDPGVDLDVASLGGGWLVLTVAFVALAALLARRVVALADTGEGASRGDGRPPLAARFRLSPAVALGAALPAARGPGRRGPALAGAVVGVAGVVAALTFGASLDRLVTTPRAYGWNWDLSPDLFEGAAEAVEQLPETRDVGLVLFRQVVVAGRSMQGVAVLAEAGAPSLTVLRGRMPATVDEVALAPRSLEALGRAVGDRITVDGNDGRRRPVTVVGEACCRPSTTTRSTRGSRSIPTWPVTSSGPTGSGRPSSRSTTASRSPPAPQRSSGSHPAR